MTAPDITDVTSPGIRASDSGSIYRPPNEERYCTLAHLDVEEQILAAAKRTVPQLVSHEQARAAAGRTGLNSEQRDVVVMMLTAAAATTVLIAPAGAGKSHTMAEFARQWTSFTGRRVIGLTTSTNAARVLPAEGLAESYNIAEFLGKIEGSDELRLPPPLHRDDVLVLDAPSQLGTTDLAMIGEAARQAGARVILTGDVGQLGPVEAGGMFRLIAPRGPRGASCPRSAGSRRQWEGEASLRLRAGDMAAVGAYGCYGRSGGREDRLRPRRVDLADRPSRGKACCCSPGPTPKPPARRARARPAHPARHSRAAAGRPARREPAGLGDLVRARLNPEIDAGGRRSLTEMDRARTRRSAGRHAQLRRQRPDGAWSEPFPVPQVLPRRERRAWLRGQRVVAQGRTVDTAISWSPRPCPAISMSA